MLNRSMLQIVVGLCLMSSLAGCGEGVAREEKVPTLGDMGAGSTKPGTPGGGTRSTADSGIRAYNLDPTSGVTAASRGTTGSVEIYTTPGH